MVGKQEPLNFILTSRVQPSLCYIKKCYHQKVKFICLDYMKRVDKYISLPVPQQEYIYSRFIRSGKTEATTEYTQISSVPWIVINNIHKRKVQKKNWNVPNIWLTFSQSSQLACNNLTNISSIFVYYYIWLSIAYHVYYKYIYLTHKLFFFKKISFY